MNRFLISYDLRKSGQDYSGIIRRLQAYGALRILESTWLLKTRHYASVVRDDLGQYVDQNDGLVTLGLNGDWAWTGPLLCTSQQFKEFFE